MRNDILEKFTYNVEKKAYFLFIHYAIEINKAPEKAQINWENEGYLFLYYDDYFSCYAIQIYFFLFLNDNDMKQ